MQAAIRRPNLSAGGDSFVCVLCWHSSVPCLHEIELIRGFLPTVELWLCDDCLAWYDGHPDPMVIADRTGRTKGMHRVGESTAA